MQLTRGLLLKLELSRSAAGDFLYLEWKTEERSAEDWKIPDAVAMALGGDFLSSSGVAPLSNFSECMDNGGDYP